MIFDNNIINLHYQRFNKNFESCNQLYNIICEDILDNLKDLTNFNPKTFINLSSRSNYLTNLIQNQFSCLQGDFKQFDLVLAPMILHNENYPVNFLKNTGSKLNSNGIFIANVFGGETLKELRESFIKIESVQGKFYPHIMPMVHIKDIGYLMQIAGFKNIVITSKTTTLLFKDCLSLMKWIQKNGESNPLIGQNKTLYSKKKLTNVINYYNNTYRNDNKIYASFEIIYLFGQFS